MSLQKTLEKIRQDRAANESAREPINTSEIIARTILDVISDRLFQPRPKTPEAVQVDQEIAAQKAVLTDSTEQS